MTTPTIIQGGQVFADLIRVTPLDALGHAVTGTAKAYITDNVSQMDYNPELQAGPDLTQLNGRGTPCLSYKGDDTIKRLNVMLAICNQNPVLQKLIAGGVAFTDGGTPGSIVGYQMPRLLTPGTPNGVAIELWQQLIDGDSLIGYEHHVFPKVKLTPANRSAQAAFADLQYNGYAYENPNWGDPYGDFGQDTNAAEQYVFSTTEPAPAGFIDVPTGAPALGGPKTITTTPYAAQNGEQLIVDATSAAITVNLPAPSQRATVTITRKNSGANAVTIATPSGQVEGASSMTLTTQWQSVTLRSDGTNYYPV